MSTTQPTNATNSRADDEKCAKIKRFILFGILAAAAIVGWHLYEHFTYDPVPKDHETPTEHEIHEFTQNLYELELKHNPYLAKVNFQGKTKASYRDDRPPQPLLQVNEDALTSDSLKTITLMRRLFDNYELDTHAVEQVTSEEQQEELDFLTAVMETPIMKKTMKFLEFKGVVTNNYNTQLQLLKDAWFTQYSRGQGRIGSSGFEHVFLAEIKDHSIIGLHNWIYFSEQEKLGHLDYKGYINKLDLEKDIHYLTSLRFSLHNINKPINTLFVGTSPELEMSLYTMCFLLSVGEPCAVQLGHVKFSIITHSWDWHGFVTNNYTTQIRLLKDLWFTQYSRRHGNAISSSGFEHVFLAEIRDNKVLGLHNWIYFSEQEKLGNLNYKGYIENVVLEKDSQYITSFRCSFYNNTKSYNSILVGTSPELELSLYTICFLLHEGKPCPVKLGHIKFKIITYDLDWHVNKTIATAYPSIKGY